MACNRLFPCFGHMSFPFPADEKLTGAIPANFAMCRFTPRATAIARGNKPIHLHNLRTLQVIPSGEKSLWKCVVCYLW